jgi:hypothetical protein
MVTHIFLKQKSLKQIFKWPLFIGLATLFGLLIVLIEELGMMEQLGIVTLLIPIITIIYFYFTQ